MRRKGADVSTGRQKPFDEPKTEGERLFREATKGLSLTKIMRDTGTRHRALVSGWLHGQRRPGAELRASIQAVYGVPVAAWDHTAAGVLDAALPLPPRLAAELDAPAPVSPGPANDVAEEPEGPPPTALEDCMHMLAIVRKQLRQPNLLASQAVKLADSKTKLLVLRAKLERDQERTEDRIVREHPAWKRLQRMIVKTLEKHPAALKDLTTALGEYFDAERAEGE